MIARLWRGEAVSRQAHAYQEHFAQHVCPALAGLEGHRGAWLLRHESEGRVEFLAVTLWDSLASIRAFAGDKVETAIVEPEARAVLSRFDETAHHYEIVHQAPQPLLDPPRPPG